MFSRRTDFDLDPHPLAALTARMSKEGRDVLDLTDTNPTRCGFVYPQHDLLAALADPHNLDYRPIPAGLPEARHAVADIYRRRGCEAAIDDLLLAPGTSDAYGWLFRLLCDPGDCILAPQPSYPLFQYLAELESIRIHPYRIHFTHEWSIDVEEVREQSRKLRPKAILLVHPNNPTGSLVRDFEWRTLAEIAAESGSVLICDEVFRDFPLSGENNFDPVREETGPAVFLNGISKLLLLPQMKLAWILLRGPADFRHSAQQRLELIADTYLSVSTPVQNALPKLLNAANGMTEQARLRCQFNVAAVRELCSGTPVQGLPVEGGWSSVLRVPATKSDLDWAGQLLSREGVLVHPGDFFDFPGPGWLVVSLLVQPDLFREGVRRLVQCVSSEGVAQPAVP